MDKKTIAIVAICELAFIAFVGVACFKAGEVSGKNEVEKCGLVREIERVELQSEIEQKDARLYEKNQDAEAIAETINAIYEKDMRGETELDKDTIFLLGQIEAMNF
jgi:hypothetical protein